MQKIGLFMIFLCLMNSGMLSAQTTHPVSRVWAADNGDGTYKNPILHADYSDPDAIRVNDDYYMVASSFNCSPGLPILHSYDLVNWEILGYALQNNHPLRYSTKFNMVMEFGLLVSATTKTNFISITRILILGFTGQSDHPFRSVVRTFVGAARERVD